MKLWRFSNPGDPRYAEASRRGTWEGSPARRVPPLVIEWEPDSDLVGDFTWPGFGGDIVVTDRVGKAFQAAGVAGFELIPVEMVENSEAPKRASKKPRVKLPYMGPTLWDLWVTGSASLDRERSTVTQVRGPDGAEHYEVSGIESREAKWDPKLMDLVRRNHPRVPGQGLVVTTGSGIFRVAEFPGWILCTDVVKALVESHGFSNVSFLEMGDILDPSPKG